MLARRLLTSYHEPAAGAGTCSQPSALSLKQCQVIITGGLGSIGSLAAAWIASTHAAPCVVLAGRVAHGDGAVNALAMQPAGSSAMCQISQCDLALTGDASSLVHCQHQVSYPLQALA